MKYLKIIILSLALLSGIALVQAQSDPPEVPYISQSGDFLLQTPRDWVIIADEEGVVELGNDRDMYYALILGDDEYDYADLYMLIMDPGRVEWLYGSDLLTVWDGILSIYDDLTESKLLINGETAMRGVWEEDNAAIYVFSTVDGDISIAVVYYGEGERAVAQRHAIPVFETVTTAPLEEIFSGSPAQELDESYSSDENGFSFEYPRRWFVDDFQEAPDIVISNRDAAFTLPDVGRFGSRLSAWQLAESDRDDPDMLEILETYLENDSDFFDPVMVELDDFQRDLVMAYADRLGSDEALLFLLLMDDGYVVEWRFKIMDGEISDYFDTILAVLETITLDTDQAGEQSLPEPTVTTQSEIVANYEFDIESIQDTIQDIDLHPDGNLLAVAAPDNVWLFDLESETVVVELNRVAEVSSLAFSPDGNTLAVSSGGEIGHSSSPKIEFYDLETYDRNVMETLYFSDGLLWAFERLDYTPDGEGVIFYPQHSPPVIYNISPGETLWYSGRSTIASYSHSGDYIAVSHVETPIREIQILDAETYDIVHSMLMPDEQLVVDIEFNSDDSRIAVLYNAYGNGEAEFEILDIAGETRIAQSQQTEEFLYYIRTFTDIAYSPGDEILVTTAEGSTVWIYDAETGVPVEEIWSGSGQEVIFAPDSNRMYISFRNTVQVIDIVIE